MLKIKAQHLSKRVKNRGEWDLHVGREENVQRKRRMENDQ